MYAKRRVVIYTWRHNPFSREHAAKEIATGFARGQWWRIRQWVPYLVRPRDGDGLFQKFRRIGSVFEAALAARFHLHRSYEAPDGVGVLLDFRADDEEEEPTFTGSKRSQP